MKEIHPFIMLLLGVISKSSCFSSIEVVLFGQRTIKHSLPQIMHTLFRFNQPYKNQPELTLNRRSNNEIRDSIGIGIRSVVSVAEPSGNGRKIALTGVVRPRPTVTERILQYPYLDDLD